MKILLALLALFAAASHMDFNDQQVEQARYCEMVESGTWPAYRDDDPCDDVDGRLPHQKHK